MGKRQAIILRVMLSINIKFDYEEQDANGETCAICGELITGKKFIPYIQIGKPEEVAYLTQVICQSCHEQLAKNQ